MTRCCFGKRAWIGVGVLAVGLLKAQAGEVNPVPGDGAAAVRIARCLA